MLPKPLSQIGLVHNPSKEEELLLIGSFKGNDIYTYNINSQRYKKKSNLDKEFRNTTGVSALSGTINNINIAVIFGGIVTTEGTNTYYNYILDQSFSCFNIINTKTMKLCLSNGDEMERQKSMIHKTGCRGHLYNEWLIVSGRDLTGKTQLSIYQLNVIKNNMIEARLRQRALLPSTNTYRFHGSILPKIDRDHDKSSGTIQVILCGGDSCGFKESFSLILIDLSNKTDIKVEFKFNAFSKVDFGPLEYVGIFARDKYWGFTCHLIKNRYILFIGGYNITTGDVLDGIFYFDRKLKKWHVCNKHLPSKLCDHSSIILNNSNLIHILGGCQTSDNAFTNYINYHWQIHLGQIFPNWCIQWKSERIIWIGFEKNENNNNSNSCFLAKMPKDIIVHILSFLKFEK